MGQSSRAGAARRDVIVIGSGFGGSFAAWPLVHAGLDVLMLERGPWVDRGPHNWGTEGSLLRTPYFSRGTEFVALTNRGRNRTTLCSCVGGPSVFYGAVSLRFRENDFLPDPELVGNSESRWPISYEGLRPHYERVERILSVSGEAGADPTEPRRLHDYPAPPLELSEVSRRIGDGARKLGLRPFPLPLAITFPGDGAANGSRTACVRCDTCDTFACAVSAKNDLATQVIPSLVDRGLEVRSDTGVTRLHVENGRIAAVDCVDRRTGEETTLTADLFLLAAGALGSAQLLLSSGLAEHNPAGHVIGRYLTRHCSAIVFGGHPWLRPFAHEFHKQLGIHDFYFGDPGGDGPPGKLGSIQQVQTPSVGMVGAVVPRPMLFLAKPFIRRLTGLLVIAEDQPRWQNRVSIDPSQLDALGMPRLVVVHQYSDRDLAARRALIAQAKKIHRAAGSLVHYVHLIDTFSHALGTARMGDDAAHHPLDADCRFRGLDNLYVVDGSALPSAAGVNPSLTIAANALRVGDGIAARAEQAATGIRRLIVH